MSVLLLLTVNSQLQLSKEEMLHKMVLLSDRKDKRFEMPEIFNKFPSSMIAWVWRSWEAGT
jgi:hypothetical protein